MLVEEVLQTLQGPLACLVTDTQVYGSPPRGTGQINIHLILLYQQLQAVQSAMDGCQVNRRQTL